MHWKQYSTLIIFVLLIIACNGSMDDKQLFYENRAEILYARETSDFYKKGKQLKLEIEGFESNSKRYNIEKKAISIKGKKFSIPQVSSINNTKKEKVINLLIRKKVCKIIKRYDLIKGSLFYFKYKTKFKNDNILSFVFKGDYYAKGLPHPRVFSFSINIDLKKSKMLKRKDIITIDDNIVRLFMEKKCIGKSKISKAYYPIYLKNDEVTPKYIERVLKGADIYLSKTGIVFIIGTIYAGGILFLQEKLG